MTNTDYSIHGDFGAREELIFRAALIDFCSKGFDGASISSIAAAVGVSEALIYKHVGGKRELLYRAIALGYQDEVQHVIDEIGHDSGTAVDRFRRFVHAQVGGWQRNPQFHLLFFHESRKPRSEYSHLLAELSHRFFAVLQDILSYGIDSGEFYPDLDKTVTRNLIVGGIDQTVWGRVEREIPIVVDDIADELSRLLLRALVRP